MLRRTRHRYTVTETTVKRQAVVDEVHAALARGHKPSHISYALGDPSFVTKLLKEDRFFRYETLARAYDVLTRDRQAYENAATTPATASVLT